MKRYETIVIIDPDISKEAEGPILERVNDLISQYKGYLIETDDWGTKKLAYEMRKKNRGHYIRFDYCGDGPLVNELERFFRIDDKVMKYMTVLLDADTHPDAVKADLAQKAAAKEKAESEKTAVTETSKDNEPTAEQEEE